VTPKLTQKFFARNDMSKVLRHEFQDRKFLYVTEIWPSPPPQLHKSDRRNRKKDTFMSTCTDSSGLPGPAPAIPSG
jgi:hypothetical protein